MQAVCIVTIDDCVKWHSVLLSVWIGMGVLKRQVGRHPLTANAAQQIPTGSDALLMAQSS